MKITLSRKEVLGLVSNQIQRIYGVTASVIDLVEIYADKSGKGSVQCEIVCEAEVDITLPG